jgi:DNA-binding LacI/PurR family transcriptional regulator
MADVARRAGVSKSTVSRVVNGKLAGTVAESTAERVNTAIKDLGYVVNGVAASLKQQYTRTVGLIVADISNPFFGLAAAGVASVLQPPGYSVIVTNTGNDPIEEARYIKVLMQQQVEAMIVATSAREADQLREAVKRGIRVVLIDSTLPDLTLDAVVVENRAGAYLATQHLVQAGHRDIAVVTGPLVISSDIDRFAGFRDALGDAGLPLKPRLVLPGDLELNGGFHRTRQVLAHHPTALLVMNNLMTIGALRAIAEAGLSIPADISLIGFDDTDWYPIFDPPITAIREPDFEIGVVAGRRLLRMLRQQRPLPPEVISLPTELIVRGSTRAIGSQHLGGMQECQRKV